MAKLRTVFVDDHDTELECFYNSNNEITLRIDDECFGLNKDNVIELIQILQNELEYITDDK